MADVSIDAAIDTRTARAMRTVAFKRLDDQVGYWFKVAGDADFGYSKTTDGGATWGAHVQIGADDTVYALDIWPDWWTPSNTGTLIHMVWLSLNGNDVLYRTLDTATDTLGTERILFNGASLAGTVGMFASITETKSGYLYCAYDIDAGAEKGFSVSTDGGVTWSASLDANFIEAAGDQCLLFPGIGVNDCLAIYQDASANELTVKQWDFGGAVATESAVIQSMTALQADLTNQYGFSASIRHSDGHLITGSLTIRDQLTTDFQVFDINGTGSITELAPITANIDDNYYPAVFIDQPTNVIYVVYNGKSDGSETLGTATKVYYAKSTDNGGSWTKDIPYMEDAAGAVFQVWAPLMGPRFYAGWRIGTTLMGNAVNSLALGGGTPTPISEDNFSFPMQVSGERRTVTVFA